MSKTRKIKEICSITRGRVISQEYIEKHAGIYPVYSSQSFNDGEMGRINSFLFDGEFVTWTTDGAYAGTVFYRSGKFSCTNVCGVIQVTDPDVSTKFLAYQLSTVAKDYVSFVGNPKLMSNIVREIPVFLPSLTEQTQIAEILATVDRAIAQTEALMSKIESVKIGMMQDLLARGLDENGTLRDPQTHPFKDSPLGPIPREWDVVTIERILARSGGHIQTGPFGSQLHSHEYVSEGVPVVMPQNIRSDGTINPVEIAQITEQKAAILRRHRIKKGDIIFARRGDLSLCSAKAEGLLCGTGCLLARFPTSELFAPWFVMTYKSHALQNQIANQAVGTTMVNLNTTLIKGLIIAKPPVAEQKAICDLLGSQETLLSSHQTQLSKLHKLKAGLMSDLLGGRVSVASLLQTPDLGL